MRTVAWGVLAASTLLSVSAAEFPVSVPGFGPRNGVTYTLRWVGSEPSYATRVLCPTLLDDIHVYERKEPPFSDDPANMRKYRERVERHLRSDTKEPVTSLRPSPIERATHGW